MGSKKKTTTATSQVYQPPSWLKGQMEFATDEARRLYESPIGTQYFPDPTFVPQDPSTLQGISQMEQIAGAPSPLIGASQQEALRTLQGDYLRQGTNPYLGGLFDIGARNIEASMASQFGRGNRAGSGAHARALSQGYENLATQLYGGAYEDERRRMTQMQALQPQLYASQFAPAQQLIAAGGLREAQDARELEDAIRRYEFEQTYPYAKLDAFVNPLLGFGGLGYGTRTGEQVTRSGGGGGGAGGILGGALTGAAIGAPYGGWGAIPGAVIGGVLGGLG